MSQLPDSAAVSYIISTSSFTTRFARRRFEETLAKLREGAAEKYGYIIPLNESRLDMLLSDMLLGFSEGAVMAVVDPGLKQCEPSLKTLKLAELVIKSARTPDQKAVVEEEVAHEELERSRGGNLR